jgi:hypothetical protein
MAEPQGQSPRPSIRLFQGTPERLSGVLERLWTSVHYEYRSIEDAGYLMDPAVPVETIRHTSSMLRNVIAREVQVRQVTTRAALTADNTYGALAWRDGGTVRVVEAVPMTVCVLDQTFAVIPLDLKVLSLGFVVVTDPTVLSALLAVHDLLWSAGVDPTTGQVAPPPRQLIDVLAAMRTGNGDDAAARRIGLSPRTYSRRVAQVLDVLGARSRFEAGLEAGRRGWL